MSFYITGENPLRVIHDGCTRQFFTLNYTFTSALSGLNSPLESTKTIHQPLHLNPKTCLVCDAPLDVLQAARGPLCENPRCRQHYASQAARERDRRHQKNYDLARRQSFVAIEELVQEKRIKRYAGFQVAPVPSTQAGVRPASPDRQQKYREHFESLLDQWVEEQEDGGEQNAPPSNESDNILNELSQQACATCRGACCTRGNTHAFHTIQTVRRWFRAHPDSTADDCREAYFGHLPTHSIEGGCIFQSARGCALPRSMRAVMCNTWKCHSLVSLQKKQQQNPTGITIIVASDAEAARRVNVVNSDTGARLEPEIEIKN